MLDKVYIEVAEMNVEDTMHDEEINEIFKYWSPEEMKMYYGVILQWIDDEKCTTKENMWQQPTYKSFFEEVQDMFRQPGRMEDMHRQLKRLRFEGYKKEKKLK